MKMMMSSNIVARFSLSEKKLLWQKVLETSGQFSYNFFLSFFLILQKLRLQFAAYLVKKSCLKVNISHAYWYAQLVERTDYLPYSFHIALGALYHMNNLTLVSQL